VNLFYNILADALVAVHLAYMAYVILGQAAILIGWLLHWRWIRNPWFRVSHLAMISIVAAEAVVGFECPLTTWERNLRYDLGQLNRNDPDADVENASFIAKLLRKILFPDADFVPYLKPCYYTFASMVLATVFLVPPRFRRAPIAEQSALPPQPPTFV
jgi:Protein of Unknown function (DUF2784)